MTTSPQHLAWIRRGSRWRLARPLLALRDRLRAYGYTVYDLGNNAHLDAEPPEHHCPYSESNWPVFEGKPMPDVVTAIDIMPPDKPGLPSLQLLGAQLFADKQADVAPWVVDMNWGPTSDRTAVRDTWRPGHVRTPSGDTGHIHLSCRSDAIDSPAGDLYDPVARLRGQTGDDMTAMTRGLYDLLTALSVGITEDGFVAVVGDPTSPNANIDATVRDSAKYTLKAIVDELEAVKVAVGKLATPPAVDVQALAAELAEHLNVDQAVVVAALQSPEGQAALVQADNTAEDS